MKNFVAIDTEYVSCHRTNGNSFFHPRAEMKKKDLKNVKYRDGKRKSLRRIIQVAAVKMDLDGNELESVSHYVRLDSEWTFQEDARDAQVVNISKETLRTQGVPWIDAYEKILGLFDDRTECMVAHNYLGADLDVLEIECELRGLKWPYGKETSKWRCTREMYKEKGHPGSSKLEDCYRFLVQDEGRAEDVHDALEDARMAGKIYAKLRPKGTQMLLTGQDGEETSRKRQREESDLLI